MTSELRRAELPDHIDTYVDEDPYFAWQKSEGVKVIVDNVFEDLNAVELGPWERKGGSGAIINIPNPMLLNDSHLVEIRPGGKSEPEHHLYEETMYVVSGRGATSVWLDEGRKSTFEWRAGSLLTIPLNAWYQHFNGSGAEPARYISVTNAPPAIRMWTNRAFIFDNPFRFTDRFSGDDADYFSGMGKLLQGSGKHFSTIWMTNFVPNADTMPLWEYGHRGAGGINTHFRLGGNVTRAHISEFPVGTYKKAHRHGPGAHLVILGGVGFSLLWLEGREQVRVDWKRGGMVIVPADAMFHQHFNTGPEPARYLAYTPNGNGTPRDIGTSSGSVSTEEAGGTQIEYDDEAPEIHRICEADLEAHGAPCRMKAFIPWCTGELGPTSARDT